MGKKRNEYFLREKQIIRLKMEEQELSKAIRNQGWIELDKPVHHGFYAEFMLRADIARREDAPAYQEALDACNDRIWSKKEDFKYKEYKSKKIRVKIPELKSINKDKYEKLSVGAKKFFVEDLNPIRNWRFGFTDKKYCCILTFELVVLKSKAYITHRREHNSILYQRLGEIDKELHKMSDGHPCGGWGYGKWWNKQKNKKLKMVAERELRQVLRELI